MAKGPSSFAQSLRGVMNQIGSFMPPNWGGYNPQLTVRDNPQGDNKNLTNYISPVQLARIRQDIQTWRDCITECENAWYPHRVKMQRLFMDTILNGHVAACLDRRNKLVTLKDWKFVDRDDPTKEYPDIKKLLNRPWFKNYMTFALQAKAFGYSLVYLGNLVMNDFPTSSIVRRFNVSPDRMNVTQFIYSISGAPFLEEPYRNWHIWCPTPTDVGVSPCGYGYLYKVAFYEIIARNVITQNVDATELYGMPIRVGKTNKTNETGERAIFEAALAEMGSAGYILMDMAGDEVELMESKSLGNGYKIYESLETRCEKKISKIILGHADAMDSVPGKLGAQDQSESPVNKALRDTATTDMNDLVDLTNNELVPKLRNLGFIIPDNVVFMFDNNEETEEVREKEDKANQATAAIYQTIKLAGGDPDWKYFTERTGIPVEATPPPPTPIIQAPKTEENPEEGEQKISTDSDKKKIVDPKVKARLEQLYGSGRIHVNGNGHLHAH